MTYNITEDQRQLIEQVTTQYGYKNIADEAGVYPSTVHKIVKGKAKKITATVLNIIEVCETYAKTSES